MAPAPGSSLHHLDAATGPRACRIDCLSKPQVRLRLFLEGVQHELSAGGGPSRQKPMNSVGERPAATDRHQARVTDAGKDHAHTLGELSVLSRAADRPCRIADAWRPGEFLGEVCQACRFGAVVFVAGVRPPTRGGAKAKESRS